MTMSTISEHEVESKLKSQVAARSVRLTEWFKDFDKRHTGKITPAQFRRGLTTARVLLTDDEAALMARKFATADGFVDYQAFCDRVDEGTEAECWTRLPLCAGAHVIDCLRWVCMQCLRSSTWKSRPYAHCPVLRLPRRRPVAVRLSVPLRRVWHVRHGRMPFDKGTNGRSP